MPIWLLTQPELLVPVFLVLAVFVLIGLAQIATAQHGSDQTHSFWYYLTGQQYLSVLGDFAGKFARWVVSHFAGAHLNLAAHWLRALGTIALGAFEAPAENAEAVEKALQSIFTHGDTYARRIAHAAERLGRAASLEARRALHLARTVTHDLTRFEAKVNTEVRRLDHAVTVTLPRDIAHVGRLEEELSRDLAKLRERTTALERGAIKTFDYIRTHPLSAATAVFTGAVSIALTRLGFGFLRCNSWKSLGKRVTCGMGSWLGALLDLIATFALVYLGLLKPQVLAEEAVAAADGIESVMRKILDN